MISVKEVPWHGLGVVLDDNPTPKEAQKFAGLEWTVRKEPVHYRMPAVDGMSRVMQVPGAFAVVRNDNHMPLGIVGENYEPFQNDQMFDFMEQFTQATGSLIETAGSLRNGKIVWALSTAGDVEYLKNDPVKQYFLFKNGFDGSTNIEICFTDVRVVCNNTLTAALRGASNIWRIRHTASLHDQVAAVKATLLHQHKHTDAMKEVMEKLIKFSMTEDELKKATTELVTKQLLNVEQLLQEDQDFQDSTTKHQKKVIDLIMELNETGAGADIPGVRGGTAYGLLNACTEYADHYKTIRAGQRDYSEARFESLLMGSGHDFKTQAFDFITELVD